MKIFNSFKKKYGQNFLINDDYSKKIVSTINITNKFILEVGSGNLALTNQIIKSKPKKFISLEIDKDLYMKIIENNSNLHKNIMNFDALKFEELKFFNKNFSIISNLPFNISSQLIFKWTEMQCYKNCIDEMVLMFQKELGERIIAKKNSKKFGKISVLIQSIFKVEKQLEVKNIFFNPIPKVDAIVLKFSPLKKTKISSNKYCELNKITSFFFNNRRKKNIKKIKKIFSDKKIKKYNLNKFFDLRAEDIDVDDYCKLASVI